MIGEIIFPISINFSRTGKTDYYNRLPEKDRYKIGPFFCATSRSTHIGKDKHAIDFLVEEGATILAVMDGVVCDIQENYNGYGKDPVYKNKTNYVLISHGDGIFSQYVHVESGSVCSNGLKNGDKVNKGSPIGRVANNGYMIYDEGKKPLTHLHFLVFKTNSYGGYQTIKVKFRLSLKHRIISFFKLLWNDPGKVFRDLIDNYLAAN